MRAEASEHALRGIRDSTYLSGEATIVKERADWRCSCLDSPGRADTGQRGGWCDEESGGSGVSEAVADAPNRNFNVKQRLDQIGRNQRRVIRMWPVTRLDVGMNVWPLVEEEKTKNRVE